MRRVLTITVLGFLTLIGTVSSGNLAASEQCAESEFLTTCPVEEDIVTIETASASVEGSWQLESVGTPENPSAEPMLATFLPDGTLIVSARVVRSANHDLPYHSTYFSTGHGTWEAATNGSVSFSVVHLLSDETGALCGSVTVTGTIVPGADGHGLVVDATTTLRNAGGVVESTLPMSLAGHRIGDEGPQVAIRNALFGIGKAGVGVLP